MSKPALGPTHDFAMQLRDLKDAVAALSTRDILQNASIGAGGLTVNGTGGITITGGGSLIVSGSGTLNVASGGLNSAGSISAGTTVTAGGNLVGGGLSVSGNASILGTLSAGATTVNGNLNTGATTVNGNLNTTGQAYSSGVVISPGSKAFAMVSSYVGAWINGDGTFGYSASTRKTKKDLRPYTETGMLLGLTPYWGRYNWDDGTSPEKVFLIAEDVAEAGFGPDVAPIDENGEPFTINYSQLVVPLLAGLKEAMAEIAELNARLAAAGIA